MTAKNGDGQPTKPGLRGNMTVKTACYVVCVCVCVLSNTSNTNKHLAADSDDRSALDASA